MSRSTAPKKFFTKQEQDNILQAIKQAEHLTSGEIRLHLERRCKGDTYERAKNVFNLIGMGNTNLKNASLIYIAIADKKFSIIGDSGIHERVPENFWEEIKETMTDYFKRDQFAEGVIHGIMRIGEKLKQYFPYSNDDVNEISDEISYT